MEEIAKYFNISLNELIIIIAFIIIIIGVAAIIFIQIFSLNKTDKDFNKLSQIFKISNYKKIKKSHIIDTITNIFPINKVDSQDILIQKIINYSKEDYNKSFMYMHLTPTKTIANKILDEGFKYHESLYKTSQELLPDLIDLRYKLMLYKQYGKYLVIIAIPKNLYDYINKRIIASKRNLLVEMVLSSEIDEDDFNYILNPTFIKGYIDIEKREIINNKKYLAGYDLEKHKTEINKYFMK